jgi:hypothetical protein
MSVETLGQTLVEAGIVDAAVLASRTKRASSGRVLLEGLVSEGVVPEASLVSQLARALSVPRYDPKERSPEPEAVALINHALAEELGILPVAVRGGGALLWVAVTDPTDEAALAEVGRRTGRRVKACLIGPRELTKALEQLLLLDPTVSLQPLSVVAPLSGPSTIPAVPSLSGRPTSPGLREPPHAVPNGAVVGLTMPPEGGPDAAHPAVPAATVRVASPDAGVLDPFHVAPDLRRIEEELAQTRHVVKVLTQALVERGVLDSEELKRRLRGEPKG